jgi:hypothetical protein
MVENNHSLQAGLVCHLKEFSVLHLESSLIAEPDWIQRHLENFFCRKTGHGMNHSLTTKKELRKRMNDQEMEDSCLLLQCICRVCILSWGLHLS